MRPVGLRYNSAKGYQIVHQCVSCGERSVNRIADLTDQPDDWDEIIHLGPEPT